MGSRLTQRHCQEGGQPAGAAGTGPSRGAPMLGEGTLKSVGRGDPGSRPRAATCMWAALVERAYCALGCHMPSFWAQIQLRVEGDS